MFQPKRTKYRKQQKGRNKGNSQRGSTLSFGTFGLKATQRGQLTSRQIEAARRAMTRHVKRGAKIWIRVFPDKGIHRFGHTALSRRLTVQLYLVGWGRLGWGG